VGPRARPAIWVKFLGLGFRASGFGIVRDWEEVGGWSGLEMGLLAGRKWK
jgi:hypothetical protein